MPSFDPYKAIVPIVAQDREGCVTKLLGTGFFVGTRPAVVTAKHVLESPLADGEKVSIVTKGDDGNPSLWTVGKWLPSARFDVAAFNAGTVKDACSLKFSRETLPCNRDVLAFEYSSTRIEQLPEGGTRVTFEPFTHKGNILRHYESRYPEEIPTPALDVSFPALQGASGAPVLRASDFAVVGMLVANHERHLVPAQIVRDDPERESQISYFLPTGKALEGTVVFDFLKEAGALPESA